MATLVTLLQLILVWLIAYAMGVGIVKLCLPADIEREHGTFIAPSVGYLAFCFFAFTGSAATGVSTIAACWSAMIALLVLSAALQARARWRVDFALARTQTVQALVLVAPMALLTLLPLLYFGADTYLGAVNPDYFAGLMDNYFLGKGHAVTGFAAESKDSYYPIDHVAGHLSASARFGADLMGMLVAGVLGVEMRTALSLCIGFFLLNLPLTMRFFARVAMGLDETGARWSAWLIGISAPIGMSYLYYYIGQNSGLPALPLLFTAAYLMLVRPGVGTLAFCALLANALFVNYFAMLPYALAPAGALALYLIATRRLSLVRAIGLGLAFAAIALALKAGTWGYTYESLRAWMNVIGQTLQGQFFLEFLTESFVPYFFGVFAYPSTTWILPGVDSFRARLGAVAVGFVFLAVWLALVYRWARDNADRASRAVILAALVIYAVVWWRYAIAQQYGYAMFKMSSWLQFIVVPFFAYGIQRYRAPAAPGERGVRRAALGACGAYVLLNIVSSIQYVYNGGGRNTVSGYIVNHFGTAGNRDYFGLSGALAPHVRADQSVGFLFSDSIRNYWTSYYTLGYRQSMLSHEIMPGDDENLPDVETDDVVDYYGNVRKSFNDFFHGGTSDRFYLTTSLTDINQDITQPAFKGRPLWENGSFRLYPASAATDILFTGRGFYRLEYFGPKPWYFPRVMRWSADGGEFYLLHPSRPGGRYRLSFDAMVGYGYPSDSRTIEVWQDGRKLHEVPITSTARVVTEPFVAPAGITKLVLRIKERNQPMPRRLGLWNRDIPADYRRTNVAFSNVRVLLPEGGAPAAPAVGRALPFLEWHGFAQAYDGIEVDGWMANKARIAVAVPAGASKLTLRGMAAGNLGLQFPLALAVSVNGRESSHVLQNPGDFAITFPLRPGEPIASLEVRSPQATDIGQRDVRFKVVRRSLRLDSLQLEP